MTRVGRRGFIGGVAGVAAVVAAPIGWVGRAFGASNAGLSPNDKVARLFSEAAGTRRIGEAYLAVAPEDNDATLLFRALAPDGEDPDEWWARVSVGELRREVRTRAHDDFITKDIVDLEGWQLSKTEARAAALFTLTQ
jgi:hypothetical protein